MKLTVFLLCLAAVLESSLSLKCYHCDDRGPRNCRDPFPKDSNNLIEECNTRAINEFNGALNIAKNAMQNFFNNIGITNNGGFNNFNSFNSPSIPEESVGCTKVVLKGQNEREMIVRGCDYLRGNSCNLLKSTFAGTDTLKFCESCEGDICNGAQSLQSSTIALIIAIAVTCLFYGSR
ncbi:uncharacterized protein LOC126900699 [Daktulosphaira vitifoliae]|uniref:uncharacterized protein LOC126900699 n=1 Tax=Daktulosphaira vitifoliae TaxID=58002 RepID=UPI0021A9BFC9|nr:uncharacterized protein LOC126900699 [Daktulosphaira vitifoliae]